MENILSKSIILRWLKLMGECPFTYYPTLSGTTLTVTPHIMDCWDTAEIKSLDKTKLVLECVGDDGNENWYTLDTYVRAE